MKNQRQIMRLKYNDKDAFKQVENALVLHYKEAWRHFKWEMRMIFTFKCSVCGQRHIRKLSKKTERNSELHCYYGYFDNFYGLFYGTYFHLLHGED